MSVDALLAVAAKRMARDGTASVLMRNELRHVPPGRARFVERQRAPRVRWQQYINTCTQMLIQAKR